MIPVLYSSRPFRFMRQVIADVFSLIWLWFWFDIARGIHDAIIKAASWGTSVQDGAGGIADNLHQAGDKVGSLPAAGDALRSPFDGAADAAGRIAHTGTDAATTLGDAAWPLALLLVSGPVLVVAMPWLYARIRFIRNANQARKLTRTPAGLHVLAIRGAAHGSTRDLIALANGQDPDAMPAWDEMDHAVVQSLASIEMKRLGLRWKPAPQPADIEYEEYEEYEDADGEDDRDEREDENTEHDADEIAHNRELGDENDPENNDTAPKS